MDSLSELMKYNHYQFVAYYIFLIVIVINTIKSIYLSRNKIKPTDDSKTLFIDDIISVLCALGILSGFIFNGILTDISQQYSSIWYPRIKYLAISSVILLLIQLFYRFKIIKLKNK
ncbi:MAG: hypothetical protein GX053_11110 [Tissierella sp.]|nr:hypothetical protein [Tissierella sp.]